MYIFKKKSRVKSALVQKTLKNLQDRKCPACGDNLILTDSGKDRDTYACEKCKSLSTFTKAPSNIRKEENVTKMGILTVREKPVKEEPKKEEQKHSLEKTIESIRDCMKTNNLANFYYTGSDGKTTVRNAEPYKLMKDKNGDLILYAYDLDSEGIRVFKIKNMNTFLKQEFTYKPRWELEDKLVKNDGV